MNIKHILFDLDGTLFNMKENEKLALYSTFRVYGIELSNNQFSEYQKINSELWEQFEKGLINQNKLLIKRFEIFLRTIKSEISPEHLNELYLYFLSCNFFLEDGARDIIMKLCKNYRLHIITNGVKAIQVKKMNRANLVQFFDDIFSAETIGYKKPDYSFFQYCIKKMNCFPKDCLIVGDSLVSDIFGGINAKMHTCWYNPLNKKNYSKIVPEYMICRLIDIYKILES